MLFLFALLFLLRKKIRHLLTKRARNRIVNIFASNDEKTFEELVIINTFRVIRAWFVYQSVSLNVLHK